MEINKVFVVRSTYHPVVKQYMDTIKFAFEKSEYCVSDVLPKEIFNKKSIVVTDSPLVAIKYMLKGFKYNCVWFQGIAPEESFMNNHSRTRKLLISYIEKKALKKAKIVFLVSNEMKLFYEKKYKINLDDKAIIMPCFNEQAVENNAFSEDKYKQNTFVYLGGLQEWQCFEQTAKIYAEIEKKAQETTKFYVFTSAKDKAVSILEKYGAKNYEVDFVSPEKLSKRIKNIKYGFVLREDTAVNNVATPTKFSNYISNGIIPVYSSSVKSFYEYDKDLELGVICNLDDIEKGVNNILQNMQKGITAQEVKTKCERAFNTYYNQQLYIEKIAEKLKEIRFR